MYDALLLVQAPSCQQVGRLRCAAYAPARHTFRQPSWPSRALAAARARGHVWCRAPAGEQHFAANPRSKRPARRAPPSSRAGDMASLLADCGETRQLYDEIDHTVQYVAKAWAHRSGGARTRVRALQPESVRVVVGVEKELLRGPPCVGRSATPDHAPSIVDLKSVMGPLKVYGEGEACSTVHRIRNVERVSARDPRTDEFHVEDYILLQSPTLAELHWANEGRKDLGPIRRTVQFFPALLVLLKLRWLIRLHNAFVEVAGEKASLRRLFNGMLLDVSGVHDLCHSPVPIYEAMITCLQTRLHQAWPFFLAFASSQEPRDSLAAAPPGRSGVNPVMPAGELDGLWEVADDIFVAWLAQQDGATLPASQMLQEFEFFRVEPPIVRLQLPSLCAWNAVKGVAGSREKSLRAAHVEAHHMAVLLEVQSLRSSWPLGFHEMVDLALSVLGHPRSFNGGVRARIQWTLQAQALLAASLNSDQATRVHRADLSDCGGLPPISLGKLRDRAPPRSVGHGPRYQDLPRRGQYARAL